MSFVALAGAIGTGATALLGGGALATTIGTGIGAIGAGAIGGAGLGALGSALTGGDVGKGAMFGALGGGLTGGLGSAIGSVGGSAAGGAGTAASTTGTAAGAGGALTPSALTNMAGSVVSPAATMGGGSLLAGGGSGLGSGLAGVGEALGSTVAAAPAVPAAAGAAAPTVAGNLAGSLFGAHPMMTIGAGSMLGNMLNTSGNSKGAPTAEDWNPWGKYYKFNPGTFHPQPTGYTGYLYPGQNRGYAEGGIAGLGKSQDSVDFMGGNMYPTSQQNLSFYSSPSQMPTGAQHAMASYEPNINPMTGELTANMANGGLTTERRNMADTRPSPRDINEWLARNDSSGLSDPSALPMIGSMLGGGTAPGYGYADGGITQLAVGGKLLKGHGDGMSDDIPANIDGKQQARLADGEFVVPADVVSHLGNGSTDAGAKQLYAMMDKVRKARTGRKAQGKKITPGKYMPA